MRWKVIRDRLLIIPGFFIGLFCLSIITYRTIIAFLSENKAVIIYINNYNEQFLDIAALIIIWIVFLISSIFLVKLIREETTLKNYNINIEKKPFLENDKLFLDLNPSKKKTGFIGFISKSSKDVEKKQTKEK